MSCANPELRGELERRGLWRDFMRLRDEAKAGGCGPAEARMRAVREVAPDLAGMVSLKGGRPKRGAPEGREARIAKVAEIREAERAEKGKAEKGNADAGKASGGSSPSAASPSSGRNPTWSEFSGRSAGWGESIDWVVAALGFDEGEVDLRSAPDAKAVSYYRACLASPAFRQDFMIRLGAARLPKKVDEDGRAGGGFDGEGEYDLAGAIASGGSGEWDGSGGEDVGR